MSFPSYGRVQVPEPPAGLATLHLHDGVSPLREVDHETPLGVLDQSDLVKQGIHTSKFVAGCKQDAQALGSCVTNTGIEWAAWALGLDGFVKFCRSLIADREVKTPGSFADTAAAERCAIALYHLTSDQTGDPSQEWPPTDCGSSGTYLFDELHRLGVAVSQKVTHAGEGLISLLQTGPVATGSPFFYAWEEPDNDGFIDGDGSPEALEAAIKSGLAGGHETSKVAVEKLVLTGTGKVEPRKTILRSRNHWTESWGDHGCFRTHLSTWIMLGGQCDFRQLVA